VTLPPVIQAMCQPAFYPHRPGDVSLVQTHISYVFLADGEVYKVKKPVRFSFLDFSTLSLRRHYCYEEVRLNQRLAGDVYLGVVGIRPSAGWFSLADPDDPAIVEYAVHMRRLPEDRMLSRLLAGGSVSTEMLDELVRRLAAFHGDARCDADVIANGRPDAVRAIIEENFSAMRPFRGRTISTFDDDQIQRFARGFLARETDLLARRQKERRIRECHGDLHADHICFTDPLVIFDCIEFSERFRYCDVASEIAFLAMDLDYHDRPALADYFIEKYAEISLDGDLTRLIPFYKCYRAYVRGKVDSLTSSEVEIEAVDRETARGRARRHFELAYRYTWIDHPRLIAIGGLSGTGKTTIAAALAGRTGFAHFSSDVVRKEIAGLRPETDARENYGRGLYDPDHTARTYRTLLDRADQQLGAGRGVILDATFQRRMDRDAVRELASRRGLPLVFVECRCGENTIRTRLHERKGGASDADWEVFRKQKACYESVSTDEAGDRIEIDTARPTAEVVAEIEHVLRGEDAGGLG
jgi:aminoglycoside phosphotransferase family enzyme/predicted kinase